MTELSSRAGRAGRQPEHERLGRGRLEVVDHVLDVRGDVAAARRLVVPDDQLHVWRGGVVQLRGAKGGRRCGCCWSVLHAAEVRDAADLTSPAARAVSRATTRAGFGLTPRLQNLSMDRFLQCMVSRRDTVQNTDFHMLLTCEACLRYKLGMKHHDAPTK